MAAKPTTAETAQRELRAAGLRATPARVAVLEALRESPAPMTHAQVADVLVGRGWDRATVFRNLNTLVEEGFASRADHGDHVWRFEAVGAGATIHEHPHFLCTECGAVECIPGIEVTVPRGGRVPRAVRQLAVEVQLKGLCDSCR